MPVTDLDFSNAVTTRNLLRSQAELTPDELMDITVTSERMAHYLESEAITLAAVTATQPLVEAAIERCGWVAGIGGFLAASAEALLRGELSLFGEIDLICGWLGLCLGAIMMQMRDNAHAGDLAELANVRNLLRLHEQIIQLVNAKLQP